MSDTPPSTGQGVLELAAYVTERHTDRAHIALCAGWHEAKCEIRISSGDRETVVCGTESSGIVDCLCIML